MNTKLLDLDDVRRKEVRGAVPPGTTAALLERGKRIGFTRGRPAYAVDHDWWREQIGARPGRLQHKQRCRRRGITIPGPGTMLAWLIRFTTFGFVRPCAGCRSRARRLNRLGWRGMVYGALGLLGIVDKRWKALRR